MKTWQAILLLLLVWAAIYPFHLGTEELRGEEARRIVPAQEMLETGDWIVPRIAGEVYSNKPPLMNWLIAASFSITGVQSEFTARLPSVLALAALALTAFFTLKNRLGIERATIVGLALLTAIAMIDKCRTAEIEAVFISTFGVACFLWIKLWTEKRSQWLVWTVPYFFLGLGCLAKGPVHLLFWALFLGFTLRSARRLRSLLHPAHFAGIGLMAVVFFPWVFAKLQKAGFSAEPVNVWQHEIAQRFDYSNIDWSGWIAHPFEIVINFLPWSLPFLFAALWRAKSGKRPEVSDRWDAVVHGSLFSVAVGCILICLTPEGLPRYVMPLYPLAALATVAVFGRLPETARSFYLRITRPLAVWLAPVALVAVFVIAGVAESRGLSVAWWQIVLPVPLFAAITFDLYRARSADSLFLLSAALIASGFLAAMPALLPFQLERDAYRPAAADIGGLAASATAPIIVYTDEKYRNRYTQQLRLLFYMRDPFEAIGESGTFPPNAAMIVGPQQSVRAMRKKVKGREITSRKTIQIDGAPFAVWQLGEQ